MRIIILLIVLFAQLNNLSSELTSRMEFLKFSPSARMSSLADTSVSIPGDLDNIFYNPAGVYSFSSFDMSISYTKWFQNLNFLYGSSRININGFGNLGIGLINVIYDDIFKVSDNNGVLVKTGDTINLSSYCIAINYSRVLSDSFISGLNIKMVNETIEETTIGYGGDIGLLYRVTDNITTGFSLLNIGIEGSPFIIKGGLHYSIKLNKKMESLILAEVDNINKTEMKYGVGLELSLLNLFMLRGGYSISDDLGALRLGGGLKYKNMGIDYSFRDFNELGIINQIGFKIEL